MAVCGEAEVVPCASSSYLSHELNKFSCCICYYVLLVHSATSGSLTVVTVSGVVGSHRAGRSLSFNTILRGLALSPLYQLDLSYRRKVDLEAGFYFG